MFLLELENGIGIFYGSNAFNGSKLPLFDKDLAALATELTLSVTTSYGILRVCETCSLAFSSWLLA